MVCRIFSLDTSSVLSCKIDTTLNSTELDIIWIHPTYENSNNLCIMNIGGDINNRNNTFTLTSEKLNHINTSSSAILYFGGGNQTNLTDIEICKSDDYNVMENMDFNASTPYAIPNYVSATQVQELENKFQQQQKQLDEQQKVIDELRLQQPPRKKKKTKLNISNMKHTYFAKQSNAINGIESTKSELDEP